MTGKQGFSLYVEIIFYRLIAEVVAMKLLRRKEMAVLAYGQNEVVTKEGILRGVKFETER